MAAARKAPRRVPGPRGEPLRDRTKRAERILGALVRAYPEAHIPLNFTTPLELLIGTILAAQCTDKKVNEVTPALFATYRTAADWAAAPLDELERAIRPTGFYRNKARSIHESTEDVAERHGGTVPDTIEALTALRGVGRKTANVVLSYAFGKPAIIVDTHFIRLARRMGLTVEFAPEKIETDLMRTLPEERWSAFSLMLTWHGRVTCMARKPRCASCVVNADCPAAGSAGVLTWKVKSPGAARSAARRRPAPTTKRKGPRRPAARPRSTSRRPLTPRR